MMRAALSVIFVIGFCGLKGVLSLSSGAPLQACDNLTPNPTSHLAQPQTGPVPYGIDYSELDVVNGTTMPAYNPGQTYTLTLTGNAGENFRGFLIQTRTVADDNTPIGTFTVNDATNSRLSSCTPSNIGITHSNGNDKVNITFDWTAPPAGTGPLRFRFAVVQVRNTYWADQSSAVVQELGPDGEVSTTMMPDGAVKPSSIGFWPVVAAALVVAIKAAL